MSGTAGRSYVISIEDEDPRQRFERPFRPSKRLLKKLFSDFRAFQQQLGARLNLFPRNKSEFSCLRTQESKPSSLRSTESKLLFRVFEQATMLKEVLAFVLGPFCSAPQPPTSLGDYS